MPVDFYQFFLSNWNNIIKLCGQSGRNESKSLSEFVSLLVDDIGPSLWTILH